MTEVPVVLRTCIVAPAEGSANSNNQLILAELSPDTTRIQTSHTFPGSQGCLKITCHILTWLDNEHFIITLVSSVFLQ